MENLVLSYDSPVTSNGMHILESRYFLKNPDGSLKENTPDELFTRVAFAVSKAEEDSEYWGNRYREELLIPLIFLPNSPVLMNMGTGAGTGSACYVVNLEDSMSSIMQTAYDAAMIEKYGGGIGFSLSDIRPKGFPITTTHGKACGPVAVLRMLSEVGTMITQGGKRDGAHMGVLEVYSPDIEEFIGCKTTEGKIHNFNISVGVDKNFMASVKNDEYTHLTWPMCRERHPIKTSENGMGQVMDWDTCGRIEGKLIRARELFSKIIHGAWLNGEPGMVWLDRMNDDNTTPALGTIKATNPCGEQPLLSSESCNLGSIDISKLVNDTHGVDGVFDFDQYREVIRLATRFLDNVIDVNVHPTEDTAAMNKKTRKIGLGIMGFADFLIKMDISYGSEEAIDWARILGEILEVESDNTSSELGQEKGSFPAFGESTLNVLNGGEWLHMRNAWRRSIAPTGTISMIANCSSGIEPLFDLAFKKHNMSAALEGVELYYIHEGLKNRVAPLFNTNGNSMEKYISEGHDVKDLLLDAHERSLFVTSGEVEYQWHIRIQAMWQKYIDSGVSKTINLPNSATEQDVWDSYMMASDLDCKGITVYRAGSREREVLVSSTSDNNGASTSSAVLVRPDSVQGVTSRITTGHGKLFMTLNSHNGSPFEVFSQIGKSGQCDAAYLEAISRLVSLCLRNNIMPETIHQQLNGIVCCPVWSEGTQVHSVPDAIALGLKTHFIDSHDGVSSSDNGKFGAGGICPECGSTTAYQEGCVTCNSCGWSKCS